MSMFSRMKPIQTIRRQDVVQRKGTRTANATGIGVDVSTTKLARQIPRENDEAGASTRRMRTLKEDVDAAEASGTTRNRAGTSTIDRTLPRTRTETHLASKDGLVTITAAIAIDIGIEEAPRLPPPLHLHAPTVLDQSRPPPASSLVRAWALPQWIPSTPKEVQFGNGTWARTKIFELVCGHAD